MIKIKRELKKNLDFPFISQRSLTTFGFCLVWYLSGSILLALYSGKFQFAFKMSNYEKVLERTN